MIIRRMLSIEATIVAFIIILTNCMVAAFFTDRIVKNDKIVKSVNYEDFSLLCADGIPLLMEDHKPRPCHPRPWLLEQKCPSGFWCHEGQAESSFYCCPKSRKFANPCHLPPAVGYGKQRMRRFYFDWKTDACHELQYSGIGGNQNAFIDYDKCEKACRGAGEPPILLPINVTERKISDKDVQTVKKVVYPSEMSTGLSLKPRIAESTLETTTVHSTVPSIATTETTTIPTTTTTTIPTTTTTTKKTTTTQEKRTTTTTLRTTTTTTTTAEEMQNSNIQDEKPIELIIDQTKPTVIPDIIQQNPCNLVPDEGQPGDITSSMWYFDAVSFTCSPFTYRGLGGNPNRFTNAEECRSTCGVPNSKAAKKACLIPPSIGDGPFNIPRYYYDAVTKKCERFFYSGRNGNDNRFIKKSKCERICMKKKPKKKKENLHESPIPTQAATFQYTHEPSPIITTPIPITTTQTTNIPSSTLRIVQNLVPYEVVKETTSQSYNSYATIQPWVEYEKMEKSVEQFATTNRPHPTLIFETQSTPMVDKVFSSLMSSQEDRLAKMVESSRVDYSQLMMTVPSIAPETSTTTSTKSDAQIEFKFVYPEKTTLAPMAVYPEPVVPIAEIPPIVPVVSLELPTTTTTTTAPTTTMNLESPCQRPLYGVATIMCESRPEVCPAGTFCQIGHGQSICCPVLDEPPCSQPIELGIGASELRRWYFDETTRLCQPFHFRGFKGNQNNFGTFADCQRACGATNICPNNGVPQLSKHTHLLSCSSNNDCEASHECVQSTPHNICCPASFVIDFLPNESIDVCSQPIETGFGTQSDHRWAYHDGRCSSFIYRGAGGNRNNFLTRQDCANRCMSRCDMTPSSGNGDQYLSRFFYSPEYRQCLHFVYSGRGGNANNFETIVECLESCVAPLSFRSYPATSMQMPAKPTQEFTFTFLPKMCPQGEPLKTIDGEPIQCDYQSAAKCPGDNVCTPVSSTHAYCCPSPMNFCLQSRPALSVCSAPSFEPIREIRFTYDPMSDRCIRFTYQNCRNKAESLNSFSSNSKCAKLCCNQGYNLVYKRRLHLKSMSKQRKHL